MSCKTNLLNDLKPDDVVYRYEKYKFFLSVLNTRKISIGKFQRWPDPFENFNFKAMFKFRDGREVPGIKEGLIETVYGQCWSLQEESDAMWRVNSAVTCELCGQSSADKMSVKLKTTAGSLLQAIWNQEEFPEQTLFFGKVQYLDMGSFKEMARNGKIASSLFFDEPRSAVKINTELARFALMKRKPFSHEKEARLLWLASNDVPVESEEAKEPTARKGFEVDPNQLFTEVVLDPHLDAATFQQCSKEIKEAGFNGSIRQSDLYGDLRLTVELNF